ncbi:MAG: cyclopropane-fatty-acyl-phospholipid synthase family protein [Rhodospirillaceae bacterium]
MTDTSGAIASYYDNLSRFLDFARRVGRGGGAQQGSTHRFLAGLPGESDSETAGPERLDHLVLDAALATGLARTPRVIDAGCGLGGTIFHWRQRVAGQYVGLTLSAEQQRRAEAEAQRRGFARDCSFLVRSYHTSLDPSYDAVVAIESLAHSSDPQDAIANLGRALSAGGLFVIVDDMPETQADPALLKGFKFGWRTPVLLDAGGFHAALTASGLSVMREVDLTARLRPRSLLWLRVLIAAFGALRAAAPTRGMRDVLDALRGGFFLEALYRTRGMRYRMIIAAKR